MGTTCGARNEAIAGGPRPGPLLAVWGRDGAVAGFHVLDVGLADAAADGFAFAFAAGVVEERREISIAHARVAEPSDDSLALGACGAETFLEDR